MKKVLTSVWLYLGVGVVVGAVIFVVATSGSDVRAELPYDDTAMKSISTGRSMARARSVRNT